MKERTSNIELLRIIALWMIVAYHIFAFCIYQYFPDANTVYKAIWLPLHVGVVVFILISGYFRIKPSVKGVVRLLSYMFIYTVPIGLINNYLTGGGFFDYVKTCLFVSNSPFWFMRTYFCLYVLSPIINRLLDKSDNVQWFQSILLLSIVALYIGLAHFDDSLNSGKNVVCFTLIYILGATIQKFQLWQKNNKWVFLGGYIVLNLVEMVIYLVFSGNIIGESFFYVCFHYCSPVLIINAALFFCFFLNMKVKSSLVNWFANSALAIYLIHTLIFNVIIMPGAHYIYNYNSIVWFVIPCILVFATFISLGCMLADKLLTPIWLVSGLFAKSIENKWSIISKKIKDKSSIVD